MVVNDRTSEGCGAHVPSNNLQEGRKQGWQNGHTTDCLAGGAALSLQSQQEPSQEGRASGGAFSEMHMVAQGRFLVLTYTELHVTVLKLKAGDRPKAHSELGIPWNQVFWKWIIFCYCCVSGQFF